MNITKKSLINKVCAILMIMALTITDFLFIGKAAVTYAIDAVATNHANVDFSAYFLNENGEKVDKLEERIDKGEKYLYVDISVKNEGYFNGTIRLNENNFVLKQEKLSENIAEISEKEVKLNQINAGSTVTIKLGIEAIKENTVNQKMLNTTTKVEIEGQYVNSKNVENEKYVDIKGTSSVEVSWIVQILVNSKITDSNYPVKNTEINLNVPEEVEDVKVHARNTNATNSNINFNENNYIYNNEDHKLTIKLSNEDENNISWNKNAKDKFVITYLLNKDQDISQFKVDVSNKITTYDDKELSSNRTVEINENIDKIVSNNITTDEQFIYKGKVYTNEEREYWTTSEIDVNYSEIINEISLKQTVSKYLFENKEMDANIVYKSTIINKQEFLKLFGENGYITVKDLNGKIIANINNNSETDEFGNININYGEGQKEVLFITSKPISVGTMYLKNKKIILGAGLTRDEVNNLKGIKEEVESNYNNNTYFTKNDKQIELKSTETKATLDINTIKLSAIEKNENVKMTVVLENNKEDRDLYKNPEIKITLPEQVTSVEAKCKLMYGKGLELKDAKIIKENGKYVIKINLSGDQTSYNTEILNGTTIIIYADLGIDKLVTNSKQQITLNYTNEKAYSFVNNAEEKIDINIENATGIITTNGIEEYGITEVGSEGIKDVKLEVGKDEKDLSVNISTINNEQKPISDVKILGKFPTGRENNLNAKLTSGINLNSDKQNVNVYYSNNENPSTDINDEQNNWKTEEDANTAKSYLITIDEMNVGEKLDASYDLNIPANLSYNMSAKEGYTVTYKDNLTNTTKEREVTTLNLDTGKGAEIITNLKAYVGDELVENGQNVHSGEIIKYEITLENKGTKTAENVNVQAILPNNTSYVKYNREYVDPEKDFIYEDGAVNDTAAGIGSLGKDDYYEIIELQNNTIETTIDKIDINEKRVFTYEVEVKDEVNTGDILTNTINIKYGENSKNEIITHKVEKSDISLRMYLADRRTAALYSNDNYCYKLDVKNLSNTDLSNIDVNINTKGRFEITKVKGIDYEISFLEEDEEVVDKEVDKKFNISQLSAKETKSYYIYTDINDENQINYAYISASVDKYNSNCVKEEVKDLKATIEITSDSDGKSINLGEGIEYNIVVTNAGNGILEGARIHHLISNYLEVESVTVNGKDEEFIKESNDDEESLKDTYTIKVNITERLKSGEKCNIKVKTKSDINEGLEEETQIVSAARMYIGTFSQESEQINNILLPKIQDDDKDEGFENGKDDPGENENPGENEDPGKPGQVYTISGTAWLDKNENGKRDANEETLKGIKVTLLNIEDNSSRNTITGDNGFYSFTEVPKGKYVAIFEYDTEKYVLTKYQVEGIEESRNSDVENVTMNLEGTSKKVASTDTIEIKENSITNIDIGLIEAKIFDLSLSKTVKKVTVTNKAGTQTKEYNDTQLAKTEIKAKNLKGTTVVIEYKIKVTNEGELAGYVRRIVDYKPSDLTFNSSLNPDWYQAGENLYTTSLANTKIEAGETKELTLILTKTMTETNTGLVNNTAEIEEDYNTLGIEDKDSKAGNKDTKEDDMGSANVIISVSTGAAVSYIALTLSIIVMIGAVGYLINKKILKENIKF